MKKNRGKILLLTLLAACLSACASLTAPPVAEESNTPIVHTPPEKEETPALKPKAPKLEALKPEAIKPDAIFFLPPADQPLPAEVTESLREILARQRGKKNILFALEAWPPAEGSLEMNIALARQAVTRLRNTLVKMGVRPYRIKTSVRGEQRSNTVDDPKSTPEKQRVDLFLSALTN